MVSASVGGQRYLELQYSLIGGANEKDAGGGGRGVVLTCRSTGGAALVERLEQKKPMEVRWQSAGRYTPRTKIFSLPEFVVAVV